MSGSEQPRSTAALRSAWPITIGAAVAVAGLLPWLIMAPLNARLRPDLPWAAIGTVAFLALYLLWLNGFRPPAKWSVARHSLLRLWPPRRLADADAGDSLPVSAILAALAVLYLLWILSALMAAPPDLSPYPTTAYRFSVLIVGALVSGIVEEAAFRGYMQRGLEQFGVHRAILITSIVFVLFHAVHGFGALLLAPGLFAASWLYGWLAVRTGSILPGIAIHSAGDMAYSYFGLLGGDWRLLFA